MGKEKERETDRQTDRQTQTQTQKSKIGKTGPLCLGRMGLLFNYSEENPSPPKKIWLCVIGLELGKIKSLELIPNVTVSAEGR